MPPLQSELDNFLYNCPIKIRFAGFESDTVKLARSGWSLSVRQNHDMFNGSIKVQLALKHGSDSSSLYMLTNEIEVNPFSNGTFQDLYRYTPNFEYLKMSCDYGLDIIVAAPNIRLQVIPMQSFGGFSIDEFQPTSGIPEHGHLSYDLSKIRWFRPLNPSVKDILIVEEDIPQVLDMILNVQKGQQDKIKEKQKQRENMKKYKQLENGIYIKPEEEVKIQIVGT